ncbi:MAG TPA: molybdopterin cofactor-binding domain-containing protein [Aliidongia sp.]|nr:molybdopterin cofactor-binding domain-containing protein [Aliidongia sp.]
MAPLDFPSANPVENVSRRFLLKGLIAAGALVVSAPLLSRHAFAYATGADAMPHGTVNNPHVFVSIDPSGEVSIIAHRAEMGPGPRTSLPMIVADEMEADWARCKIVQAPGDEATYGNQDTDGSRSIRHFLQPMRQCGAAARQMLEQAAAKRWGVDASSVKAQNHEVVHAASGRKFGYGELAADAAALPVPPVEALKLKDSKDFRYIGQGKVQIYDLHDITTGKAGYGIDTRLPGMKFAVIARPPVVGGKLVSFDATEALKVPGVEKVIAVQGWPWPSKFQPLGGVAVIARNTGSAIKGRDALKIVWDDGPNKGYDSVEYRKLLEAASRQPGEIGRDQGDIEAALKGAAKVITAEYYLPHLAHASMEPPAAVADVKADKAEIWAPVQSAGGTHEDAAKTLGLPMDKVKVNVTLLGGAFGRKSKCDFALEAALLSKELGVPVQVTWTREDDIRHDFYHTVSAERIEAAVDAKGKVTGWRHRSTAPSILSTFKEGVVREAPLEQGMSLVDVPFDIPNIRCETGEAAAHTRIGWFRSVSNIPHGFAQQCMVAEIAHELGKDPKDFLLEIIGPPRIVDTAKTTKVFWNYGDPIETYPNDAGRLRKVVEIAAEKSGWGKKLPKGRGMGIAAMRLFLTYVATVVEVEVDEKGAISVPRVDVAIDCGFHVNPERILSQFEGASVMALSLAKYGAITFKDGKAEQGNFDDYQVIRIDEAPRVTNVHIVPHPYEVPASGIGEPGLATFPPALLNAVFAATGKRIRSLPIADQLKA